MLKIVSKFTMDILPSVVATIIGAYIVNHYIVAKPDAPVAAAVSSADPKKAAAKVDAKPAEASTVVSSLPQPGITAKGISEKAMLEQTAAERPTVVEKPAEKSADKPADTASIPVDSRRHPPVAREKAIAKPAVTPAAPATPAVAAAPVVAAPATAPAAEAVAPPDEHRDANELARAAIERLRGVNEGTPRPQEAARNPEPPRAASAPPVVAPVVASAPPVRPLPPPIMVSTPAGETFNPAPGSPQVGPSGIDDPRRPIPPADIPEAAPTVSYPGPLDLRAEGVEPQRREHNVAEDMLLAAKSVFHAVLPK